MKKIVLFFSAGMFMHFYIYAQQPPIRFGDVDIKDLKSTVYEPDSSASAVILCDYGHFYADRLEFLRILRIKILKKEGYYWADRLFRTPSKSDIKGFTYNLVDGKIVKDKLKYESILAQRVTEGIYIMHVAMPNVKTGSIIDFEYTHFLIPTEWRFQDQIPVVWSELIIEPSEVIDFQKNFFGFEKLAINTDTRWVAKNMPAFKAEPYINSYNNYITKFEFEILAIRQRSGLVLPITNTWEDVCTILYKDHHFGDALIGSSYLSGLVKNIESGNKSKEEKLKAAFESIKQIKWNENVSLFASTPDINTVYNKKIGNSADINLALIQLLKKLDMDAHPVVLSTRDNGMMSPVYPSLNKLNYVIANVSVNDKVYFLDATEELIPYYLIPERCLNWKGRIIEWDRSGWADINTVYDDKSIIYYDLSLDKDLFFNGKINYAYYDYAAFNFRKNFRELNSKEEFLESFQTGKPGLKIKKFNLVNLDSIYLPVKNEFFVQIKNQVIDLNTEFQFTPLFYDLLKENPFKNDHRLYPVDFGYGSDKTIIAKILIPDDLIVTHTPKNVNYKLPGNTASLIYQVAAQNNILQLSYKLVINSAVFSPEEYPDLREFYKQVINIQADPVILKRK